MRIERALLAVTAAIGFATVAVSADPTLRQASAQSTPAEIDREAQELVNRGHALLFRARFSGSFPISLVADINKFRSDAFRVLKRKQKGLDPQLADALSRILQDFGSLVGYSPLPDIPVPTKVKQPELPPAEWPEPPRRHVEEMGLDNPGGYVNCHGAVAGALGKQRDPSRQVRQSMLKECPHLVGGAGRN